MATKPPRAARSLEAERARDIADKYAPRPAKRLDQIVETIFPPPSLSKGHPRSPKGTKSPAGAKAYRDKLKAEAEIRRATEKPVKRKMGRPSSYSPDYCQTVIDDATKGYSLSATAALIGVAPMTLGEWGASFPEFADAIARAKAIRLRGYEKQLIEMTETGGDAARLGAVKFAMINVGPTEWRERFEVKQEVTLSLGQLIDQSMRLAAPTIEGEAVEVDKPSD